MLVFTAIYALVVLLKIKKDPPLSAILTIRKLSEYAPFVAIVAFVLRRAGVSDTSYNLDIISVVFWVLILFFQFCLSSF